MELVKEKEPDLILLDINLPDGTGFDLFKKIKEYKDIPIIFLTANDLEVSVVMGLDMGADDYITKPFKARELVSRIKNVLRRTAKNLTSNVIDLKNITIDMKQAKVFKNGVDVMLTALEYKILLILALNPNVVFSREKILADIWDVNEAYVNDNTLTVYMKRIREKIEDLTFEENPEYKCTVSVGIYSGIPDNEKSAQFYIDYADQALYMAKESGRNCVVSI